MLFLVVNFGPVCVDCFYAGFGCEEFGLVNLVVENRLPFLMCVQACVYSNTFRLGFVEDE